MSISGNLETMGAAEVFQWLAQSSKTGTLVLSDGTSEKRVYFDRGAVTMTASTNPKEYLGHFLVSHGLIDERALAEAIERQESNRVMLGKILITEGALSEQDLEEMLRLKLEESLYAIFTWPRGEFRFIDGESPDRKMVPLALDIDALVLEGTKRADEWKRIRKAIPSLNVIPVTVKALRPPRDEPLAKRILDLVDDDRTIEEIALHARTSEFHACRAILAQVDEGRMKLVRVRQVSPAAPLEDPDEVDAEPLLSAGRQHLGRSSLEQAMRYFRAAASLEPNSDAIRREVAEAEASIRKKLEMEGIVPAAVPRLDRRQEDLASFGLTPQEGFILTRINGIYDVQTILQISPMPPLEVLLVFHRLRVAGHIVLS